MYLLHSGCLMNMTEQAKETSQEAIKKGEGFQSFSTAIYSIRAISIILIILFHFGFYTYLNPSNLPDRFIQIPFAFGEIGVDLLIFLSAMFLAISLCRKDQPEINWKSWYEGRVTRIFPLLWLSFLIIIPSLALIGMFYDVNSILISMSGLGSVNGNIPSNLFFGYLWFITFILIFYLFFPLFYLGTKKNLRIFTIVVISIFTVFILVCYPLFSLFSGSQNIINIFFTIARFWNFGFGALFGYWIGKNKMENLKYFADKRLGIISGLGLAVSFTLYVISQMSEPYTLGYHYYEKFVLFPIISFFLIVFFTYMFMKFRKANKPFGFIGKMNYEVYLLHGVPPEITIFVMFAIFLLPPSLILVALAIVLVADILIAYPLKFMGDWVERKINVSKKFERGILIIAGGLMIYAIVEMVVRNFINLSVNWAWAVIIFSLILVALISIDLLIRKYKKRN